MPKRQSCDLAIQTASSEAESNSTSRPPTNGIEQDTNNYSRPSSDRNEQVNMGANMDRTKKERTESGVHTHSDTALPDRSDSISPFSHTLIRKQLVGVSAQLVVNLERVEDRIDNGNEAETDISLNKTNLEQPSNTGLRNSDSPQLKTKRQKLSIEDKTCSVCGWVGRGRGDVQDHMVKHTGEKRFSCSKCHEKFKCRPGRIRHQRKCRVGENRKDQCSSKSRVDFTKKDKVKNVDNVKVLGYSKSTEGFTKKDKAKRVVNDKDETASESNADLMKKDKGKSVVNDSSQSVSSGSVDFTKFTKKDTVQTMFNEMDQSVPSANIGFSKKNTQTRTKNLKNGRQCHYCGKIWATVTQLKIHLPKHTGERNFKCSKCDLRYKYPKNLRMHEKKCSGSGVAAKRLVKFATLKKHVKVVNFRNVLNKFKCKHCQKQFSEKAKLDEHAICHTKKFKTVPSTFVCKYCQKHFSNRTKLVEHIVCHTKEKLFSCSTCKLKFVHRTAARSHMIKNNCGGTLISKVRMYNLTNSKSLSAGKAIRKVAQKGLSEKRKFVCSICSKAFMYPSKLKEHQQVHIKMKKTQNTAQAVLAKAKLKAKYSKKEHKQMAEKTHLNKSGGISDIVKPTDEIKHVKGEPQVHGQGPKSEEIQSSNRKPHSCEWCLMRFEHFSELKKHQIDSCSEKTLMQTTENSASRSASKRTLNTESSASDKTLTQTMESNIEKAEVVYFSCDKCHKKFKYRKLFQMHIMKSQCKLIEKQGKAEEREMPDDNDSSDKSKNANDTFSLTLKNYIVNAVVKPNISSKRWQTQPTKESRIHPCPICDCKFTRKDTVERHLKRHIGENMICKLCGLEFKSFTEFEKHAGTAHTAERGDFGNMTGNIDNNSEIPVGNSHIDKGNTPEKTIDKNIEETTQCGNLEKGNMPENISKNIEETTSELCHTVIDNHDYSEMSQ